MDFRENLLKKIEITRLSDKVIRSINPTDGTLRIDLDTMKQLLVIGGYAHQKERDLDLYRLDDRRLLLLDNELKIYNTTAEDVALRKSPTTKEMISIRNAIKILNDKDVVISRKADSVRQVQTEMIDCLDLSYTAADISSMAEDGTEALKNKYTDGIIEILTLFAELLAFVKAPKAFQVAHHHIWGRLEKSDKGDRRFGPLVLLDLMHNSLKMHPYAINTADKAAMEAFKKIAKGEVNAELTGPDVVEKLKEMVLETS